MQIKKSNGDELILHGEIADLEKSLAEIQRNDPMAKGKLHKEGDTIRLKNGTDLVVTKEGLLAAKNQMKRKKISRLKNKSARCERKKMRSRKCH